MRDKKFKFQLSEEQQIVKVYQAGYTMRDIANVYKCKSKTIKNVLVRAGIETRESIHHNKLIELDKMVGELYRSGYSFPYIKAELGISFNSIKHSLNRLGITTRGALRKHFFNESAFDNLDNEQALYWLGFLYADGNINNNNIRIGLSIKDKSHLVKFQSFLENETVSITSYKGISSSITFYSQHMGHRLANLGLTARRGKFNKKTKQNIPKGLEHHFIRGIVDGDGCITKDNRIIILGRVDILTWIIDILHTNADAHKDIKIRDRGNVKEISWGGKLQFQKIINYIYQDATISLDRKRERIKR